MENPRDVAIIYVTHSVRSSPCVGIFTSGRVGGGAVRDDFVLGCISIVIIITTTNADNVTVMSLLVNRQSYVKKFMAHKRPCAYCPILFLPHRFAYHLCQ